MKRIFAIIGGDARQISLAARLSHLGAVVRTYGLPQGEQVTGIYADPDWKRAVRGTDAVLLPLPTSPDGVRINMPLSPEMSAPAFSEILDEVAPTTAVIGGKFTPLMRALAEEKGRLLLDYCKSDTFAERNAIPTAEGAVAILMDRETHTIKGLPVAITGFGRVASALARLLLAMGAEVTVGARRKEQLLAAAAAGCRTVRLGGDASVIELAREKAAVFNTVPAWLFTEAVLREVSKGTLIVDLASAPGGVDAEAARALGHRVIFALSLPGKYSPATAGEIMADTVLDFLAREVTL